VTATLNRCLEHLVIALFAALCLVVFGEVVARYAFNRPYFWSEEVTVYAFTWVAFLGSALALRDGRHIGISYFVSLLPPRGQVWVGILADGVVLGFLGLFLVQSIRFCFMNHSVVSIALQIPLSYVSASLVVMAVLMIGYSLRALLGKFRGLNAPAHPAPEGASATERVI
jgi:TRAP-type C4-dicarboxylate transport system permease small subunit